MALRFVYRLSNGVGGALFRGEPDIKLSDASTRPKKYIKDKRKPTVKWGSNAGRKYRRVNGDKTARKMLNA